MDAPKEAQVLVVEDDKDFALLIQQSLENTPGLSCVGIAAGKDEAVQLAKQLFPDIVLMDLNLSATRMDGIDAAREIRLAIRTHVVILTVYENPEVVLEASIPQAVEYLEGSGSEDVYVVTCFSDRDKVLDRVELEDK